MTGILGKCLIRGGILAACMLPTSWGICARTAVADARWPIPAVSTDPADSLYRSAREALNASRHDDAARLFRQVRQRFPRSAYAADTHYWEAFALYRRGGEQALRQALRLLDEQTARFPNAATQKDAGILALRIRGILARAGDPDAGRLVAREATAPHDARSETVTGAGCASGDLGAQITALNALARVDPARATSALRGVLSRRDSCSAPAREKAVLVVAGTLTDKVAEQILLDVVRNDPEPRVRRAALLYLAVLPGSRPVGVFEGALRQATDLPLRKAAIAALAQHASPRAGELLREVVEQAGWSFDLKVAAIGGLALTPGNEGYLRNVFSSTRQLRIRVAVVESLGQIGTGENLRWLLALERDRAQPPAIRRAAAAAAQRVAVLLR